MALDLELHKEFEDHENDQKYTDYMTALATATLEAFPTARPRVRFQMKDFSRTPKIHDDADIQFI